MKRPSSRPRSVAKSPSSLRKAPGGVPRGNLAHRLRRASHKQLLGLVNDHLADFRMGEVRQTLLNPHVSGDVIEELMVARHLLSAYEFRRTLARHRRTPESVAMRFVSGLFWRDLLEITLDMQLRPMLRRLAERYLLQRLSRLTEGEKIALGRRATGAVVAQLRHDPSLRVVRAVLENPRLSVHLLTPLATESDSPRVLDLLANNERWGRRYEIRAALAQNPAIPIRAAFAILPTLYRGDLVAVARNEEHSSLVRNRAREIIDRAGDTRIQSIEIQ